MATFLFLVLLRSLSRTVYVFFRHLGGIGLLLLGILDSSFLVMPLGNDLLIIGLISAERRNPQYFFGSIPIWVYYVIIASIGSMIGVLLVDLVMRRAGERGLAKFVKPERIAKLKAKMETHAGLAVITATLMPPPFPFTAVIMTASALQYPRKRLLLAVFCGRIVRFTIEAMLALAFGRRLERFLNSRFVEYAVIAFMVVAVIASIISVSRWIKSSGDIKPLTARRTAN